MVFIEVDNLNDKIVNTNIEEDVVYEHFKNKNDEVLYVLDDDRTFYGMITPGDYYRYICCESDNFINNNCTVIDDINYEKAQEVLKKIKSIHEVPVVCDGKLRGIISNELHKADNEWAKIRKANEIARNVDEGGYIEEQVEKILNWYDERNVILYIIEYPSYNELGVSINDFGYKYGLKDGMSGFLQLTEADQKAFYQEDYYPGKIEEFAEDYNQLTIEEIDGRSMVADIDTDHFHVRNGHRLIINAKIDAKNKIYLFGPCNAFGAYVQDDRTIGFYLQNLINQLPNLKYEVVISAKTGGFDLSNMFCEEVGQGDIVIFFANYLEYSLPFKRAARNTGREINVIKLGKGLIIGDNWTEYYYNCMMHSGHRINENIANYIYERIGLRENDDIVGTISRKSLQNYYILPEIYKYIHAQKKKYMKKEWAERKSVDSSKTGAIVMNCNPFTLGHFYLIEEALKNVEVLYIFVVEEDKSVFRFQERFKMVVEGVKNLKSDIRVIPSGEYIISNKTFAQYFDKENDIKEIKSMDYDIRIFGEVVAKEYNIGKRFAGEEPIDHVTKKYNDTMRKILPEYGIEFVEIPRLALENGNIISATKVRKLIGEQKWHELKQYLPTSTIQILKKLNGD